MDKKIKNQEGKKLAELLKGRNKSEFSKLNKIPGGASMVSQNISGNRPISLEAAIIYAKAFNCKIKEISPRLANKIERARGSDVETEEAMEIARIVDSMKDKSNREEALKIVTDIVNIINDKDKISH